MAEALRGALGAPAPERSSGRGALAIGALVLSGGVLALAAAFALASPGDANSTPSTPTPTSTPGASASPAPELTWRLPREGELRYRLRWKETGFKKAESRADSILVLSIRPLSARARRVEARWQFSEFASYRNEVRAAFVPSQTLDLAKDVVVFKGDLDLVTGSWTVHQRPSAVRGKIQAIVDPELVSRDRARTNKAKTDTAHWAGTWAACFFHPKPLPRLLEILFSTGPLNETNTGWRERPGLDRISGDSRGGRVIYPYLWALTGAEIKKFGSRQQVKVDGERFRERGLPRSLDLTQTVTLPDGSSAEDVVKVEILR